MTRATWLSASLIVTVLVVKEVQETAARCTYSDRDCLSAEVCVDGQCVPKTSSNGTFNPVIIVPGTAGSQLEAKLNKPSVKHFYCSKTSDWYMLWLSVTNLLPPAINCWCDNIMMKWDNDTKLYSNNDGVETRTPGWGTTVAMEYLDPSLKKGQSDYLHDLVNAMVEAGGQRNISIRGSPYDFRRAPTSAYSGKWKQMMIELVEETYSINNNKRVTILSHSMGCLYSLWFLNQMSIEWKSKYIKAWFPTSGVFGGAGGGLKQLLSGDNEGIPGISGLTVREEQRSYESSMILAPTQQVWGNYPLARTPNKNYTASDYQSLFQAANFKNGFERWSLLANLTANLDHPEVDVIHFYGTGVSTPTAFEYKQDFNYDEPPTTINGDGDGTVPLPSLASIGKRWQNNSAYSFQEITYPGQSHTGIVKCQSYMSKIILFLSSA